MTTAAILIACVALLGYWVVLQRRGSRRDLEETARFRNAQHWLSVLDEDRDPGESFVEYQERTHVKSSASARGRG